MHQLLARSFLPLTTVDAGPGAGKRAAELLRGLAAPYGVVVLVDGAGALAAAAAVHELAAAARRSGAAHAALGPGELPKLPRAAKQFAAHPLNFARARRPAPETNPPPGRAATRAPQVDAALRPAAFAGEAPADARVVAVPRASLDAALAGPGGLEFPVAPWLRRRGVDVRGAAAFAWAGGAGALQAQGAYDAALAAGRGFGAPAARRAPALLAATAAGVSQGGKRERNFKGSYLGRFPLVSADFWTSDHLSERHACCFRNARARNTHVEATSNLSFPAQASTSAR